MKRDELVACVKSRREWEYWIAKFDDEERANLKEQFDSIAKQNVISQNALYEFMGIKDFRESPLGDKLFGVFLSTANTHFFNWETFLVIMGIIHKGEMEDKIDLLYSLFDINNDHCVDKPEMIGLFNHFFNILKKVSFKSEV